MLDSVSFQHGVSAKNAFRRHNSCVDFTFLQDKVATNSYKLTRLNVIFEKAADRRSGGIREDKLARILPQGELTLLKYGMILNAHRKSSNKENTSNGRKKKKDLRIISRGPFLAMFAYENAAFLGSLASNEKTDREKRQRRSLVERGKKLRGSASPESNSNTNTSGQRERAHTAPSSIVGAVDDNASASTSETDSIPSLSVAPPPLRSPSSGASSSNPSSRSKKHSEHHLNGKTNSGSRRKSKNKDRKNRDRESSKKKREGRVSRSRKDRSSRTQSKIKTDVHNTAQVFQYDTTKKLSTLDSTVKRNSQPSAQLADKNNHVQKKSEDVRNGVEGTQSFPTPQVANAEDSFELNDNIPGGLSAFVALDQSIMNRISYSYSSSSSSDGASTRDSSHSKKSNEREEVNDESNDQIVFGSLHDAEDVSFSNDISSHGSELQRHLSNDNLFQLLHDTPETNNEQVCAFFESFISAFKKIFAPSQAIACETPTFNRPIEDASFSEKAYNYNRIGAQEVSSEDVEERLRRKSSRSDRSRRRGTGGSRPRSSSGSKRSRRKKSSRPKGQCDANNQSDTPFQNITFKIASSTDHINNGRREIRASENGIYNSSNRVYSVHGSNHAWT